MRAVFTSVLAFFVSVFAGGMVAQVLAVSTDAGEEYILVFMATVLSAIIVTVPFFVAQFFSKSAIDRTGLVLSAMVGVALLALIVTTLIAGGPRTSWKGDVIIIAGLILPSVAIVLAQWLLVRGMFPRPAMAFGRATTGSV